MQNIIWFICLFEWWKQIFSSNKTIYSYVLTPNGAFFKVPGYLIFKASDKTQLHQIYSAFGNTISWSQFSEVYNIEATGNDPHGFLYIDVVPKEPWRSFAKGSTTSWFLPPKPI